MAEQLDLVISAGTLVSSRGQRPADIGLAGERIAAIAEPGALAGRGAATLAAGALLVLPGLIDGHVHFRSPGLEHEEDWLSGSRAAVMGGVTSVLEMPNTVPPTATVEAAQAKLALGAARAYCDFGIFGLLGENSAAVAELAASGLVVGIKAFLGPTTGDIPSPSDDALRAGLTAARAAGLRTVFHAEAADVVAQATAAVRAAGRDDARAHLDARPVGAEVAAIERIGRLLVETGAAGHIAHLTSAEGLAAVERWRVTGADLTCELTPHHALLGLDAYDRFGGLAKVNPPIRGETHPAVLLAALADGRIDCLASDHAPHALADNQRPSIWDVPAGFCGVETLLPLLLTEVAAGRLPIEALVRATSERPAQVWGLWPRKGALEIGADADLTLVDPQHAGVVRAAELHGKNNASPWEGRATTGAAVATIVRGRIAMRDGELLGGPGWGAPINRGG
jgi:dihydroorotase (multifunctional complex type)